MPWWQFVLLGALGGAVVEILAFFHDIAAWRDLCMDELVVAPPGLHNSDETLYELIEDIRAAGVEFPRPGWGEGAARP